MKKRILTLALILSQILALIPTMAYAAPDNVVNFSDQNFENAVREQIGKPTGAITQADLAMITKLSVVEKNISSLSGIEHFTKLEELDCSNNQITKLDLSKNTALTRLDCSLNDLAAPDALDVSKNIALTFLACSVNQMIQLNLINNTALLRLNCSVNRLTEIDVSKNIALESLNCGINQLTKLDVSKNRALKNLSCNENFLPNESAVIGLDLSILSVGFVFTPQWTKAPKLDSASDWALDDIQSAYNKGFIPEGIQGDYGKVITRQEFCRMAVMFVEYALEHDINEILASRDLSYDSGVFYDTTDSYILAAYALGITNGTKAPTESEPGRFSPNGQFSRQEAATMIMRACKLLWKADIVPTSDFEDLSEADNWALEGINFVYAYDIMNGVNATTPIFNPKGTYTRQESIVTFNRII